VKIPKPIIYISLALLVLMLIPHVQAQTSEQPAPAEITREDDHLPFMRQENAVAAEDEPSSATLAAKSLGALMLVVGLIFFGAWGARKLGFGNARPETVDAVELSVVNTLPLGGGRSLIAVNTAEPAVKPRSVAEMLEEESGSFRKELETAEARGFGSEVRL
jgi:hypothetical protein